MNRTPFKRTMKNIKNFHGRHPGVGRFLCCRDNMLYFFRRSEKTGIALQPVGIAEGDFSSIISARLSRPANRLPQHRFCLRIPQKPSRNFWQCSAPLRVCFESFRLFRIRRQPSSELSTRIFPAHRFVRFPDVYWTFLWI